MASFTHEEYFRVLPIFYTHGADPVAQLLNALVALIMLGTCSMPRSRTARPSSDPNLTGTSMEELQEATSHVYTVGAERSGGL